jgi:hypothetical protein
MRTPAGLAVLAFCAHAAAQSCSPELAGAHRIESPQHVLAYRSRPARIAVGEPFALDVVACSTSGAPANGVAVDATMPEHGHGMNYRPTVRALGGGRFEAQGLMFHMPGRWSLTFEVRDAAGADRLSDDLVVP